MIDDNPFSELERVEPQKATFDPEGRIVEAGRVFAWLQEGWQLFLRNPGIWIAMAVIILLLLFVLNMVPGIGHFATALLSPILVAGTLAGCRDLKEGKELRIDHLLEGFRQNVGNLLLIGVLYLVGLVLVGVVIAIFTGGAMLGGALVGKGLALSGLLFAVLAAFFLSVPLAMAVWFAPALVIFRNLSPIDALKASFNVWLKNISSFIVTFLVVIVLSFLASLTFMLGMLVLLPVLAGMLYTSYMEIFE